MPSGPVRWESWCSKATSAPCTRCTFPATGPELTGGCAAVPFEAAIDQLEEYFAGTRTAFELCLQPGGSPFDQAVWRQVSQIPYGQTRSYAEVARAIGRTDRVRAVGSANARNPLPIIVPCHRVIGSDGSLTGYAGGLDRKRSLLTLEQGAWQQTLL